MELYDDVFRYDRVQPSEFLNHILTCYAELDDEMLEKNKKEFEEPPDMSKPIDVYFRKQERCMKIAADGSIPISEGEMVQKLQIHMGQSGMVNGAYTKWKRKPRVERRWAGGKIFFRTALKEAGKITKIAGDYSANALVTNTQEAVRTEMVEQMGEAFDNLAMAATAKQETMDSMVKTIADLTAANATLTKANLSLTQQLQKCQSSGSTRNKTRNGGGGGGNGNGGGAGAGTSTHPPWTDPDAYCYTCGYKLRKGHNSATCTKAKDNPEHKKEATRNNPMGGTLLNAGWGNAPNGTERQ